MGETRVFVTRRFDDFCHRARLSDRALDRAVIEIESGLVHADLGGNVYKQRIPRPGAGKSGGFRTVLVFRIDDRAIYLRGFAKNEQEDITAQELRAFREAARVVLSLTWTDIETALASGELREIEREQNNEPES